MNLSEFKIVKNRQRPDFCYAYEKYNADKTEKYSLFTMNGGKTFLASVISTNNLGKLVDTDFSETFNTKEEGLNAIVNFLSKSVS
jgi:hypothetical protein